MRDKIRNKIWQQVRFQAEPVVGAKVFDQVWFRIGNRVFDLYRVNNQIFYGVEVQIGVKK